MGDQKIAHQTPKKAMQKNQKFLWGKSYMQIKFFGSMRVSLRMLSKFAQTYSLTSRAFWLKKPRCARMSKGSKPPRKICFRLLLLQKKSNRQMGYEKIAQRNPKTGVQKIKKNCMGKKLYANQVFWVNEGIPANSFKICTDILLDKPSILAEETLLCTEV